MKIKMKASPKMNSLLGLITLRMQLKYKLMTFSLEINNKTRMLAQMISTSFDKNNLL